MWDGVYHFLLDLENGEWRQQTVLTLLNVVDIPLLRFFEVLCLLYL